MPDHLPAVNGTPNDSTAAPGGWTTFVKEASVLANPPLQETVIASLERDPRIPEPLTIAVSAQGNVLTLRVSR